VVDDHDFDITHVIRAEEHLSNTPRQIFILESLGYPRPVYAHLPYVAEPGSKTKLSKRKLDKYLKNRDFAQVNEHGRAIAAALGLTTAAETFNPVIVDFYEQVGYLPDAIINYLVLLGWSLDERTEFFTRQQMIDNFSLERVNKAPASFDPKKLWSFQDHYMQELSVDKKLDMTLPYLLRAGVIATPATAENRARLRQVIEAAGDRIKVAGDILDFEDFFRADDQLAYDEVGFEKQLRDDETAARLGRFRTHLAAAPAFDPTALETLLQAFVTEEGIGVGRIIHAIRLAATGKTVGFGLFETLAILGREASIARIDRALAQRSKTS
jgi:glutamyl-tRNA synthetase